MNELYGIDPEAYQSARELRYLISAFGPFSGKYILPYPSQSSWEERIFHEFQEARDIERERIKTVIKMAKERSAIVNKPNLPWIDGMDWARNAIATWATNEDYKKVFLSDRAYDQLIASSNNSEITRGIRASDPEPLGPADRQIDTDPESYWRVSKILCFLSRTVHFVDPFLNPMRRDRGLVLSRYLEGLTSSGKVSSIQFWVRRSIIPEIDDSNIKAWLVQGGRASRTKLSMRFNMVNDENSADKLHARYLLTEKGGIKFDQGFQQLPGKRKNIVSPIGLDLYQKLYRQLIDRSYDFVVSKYIQVDAIGIDD